MAEIDSLGSNTYFSGVQNAANEALRKNRKTEEAKSTKKTKFGDILHKTVNQKENALVDGFPPEISTLSVEEKALYLKDMVDIAGNNLSEQISTQNIEKFKSAVGQFLKFVVNNNYNVRSHNKRVPLGKISIERSRSKFMFSSYDVPPRKTNPRYQIEVINKKLSALTAATIEGQKNNLLILAQVDEIKGLIIDLMSS